MEAQLAYIAGKGYHIRRSENGEPGRFLHRDLRWRAGHYYSGMATGYFDTEEKARSVAGSIGAPLTDLVLNEA